MPFKLEDYKNPDFVYELPKVSDNFKQLFLSDDVKNTGDDKTPRRTLIVTFKSTHAGRKTRNDTFYLAQHVKNAINTWTKDYCKPVQKDHGRDSDKTIGRVIGARYVDLTATAAEKVGTDSVTKINDSISMDKDSLNAISKIVNMQESGVDWEGLGYDELVLEITDPDSIDKFLRNEYVTGSSGKTADTIYCSICGQDFLKDGLCEHRKGQVYDIKDEEGNVIDSKRCIWVAGSYVNDEFSITPFPANEKASKTKQEIVLKDCVNYYVYEKDNNILNKMDDITKNLLTRGVTLNDVIYGKDTQEPESKTAESNDTDNITMDNINEHIIAYADSLEGEDEEYKGACSEDCLDEEVELVSVEKQKKAAGGSNAGKYKTKGPFCGSSGGAPKNSYPINTLKRAKAALAYARHAPNPAGIKSCVCRHWPSLPSCKGKAKTKDSTDTTQNIFFDEYSDWSEENLSILQSRLENVTDEDKIAEIRAEVEADVFEDEIRAIKYEEHIVPKLKAIKESVKKDKKLDDVELSAEDVIIICEGIDKAILPASSRKRLSKKNCILTKEIPVLDKYHVIALTKLMEENGDFSVTTKERFLFELARLNKSIGNVQDTKEEHINKTFESFDAVYNTLDDNAKKLVDNTITEKIEEAVSRLKESYVEKAEFDKILNELKEAKSDLKDTEEKAERYLKENKAFTKITASKQEELVNILVENIIDLKLVSLMDDTIIDIESYTNELLTRSEDSLKDQLKDLRKVVRKEFLAHNKQGDNSNSTDDDDNGGQGNNAKNSILDSISPAQLRYYQSVKLKLDKYSN